MEIVVPATHAASVERRTVVDVLRWRDEKLLGILAAAEAPATVQAG